MFKTISSTQREPSTNYADNAESFQPAAKWLKQINKNEQLHEHLTRESINWKFNLPKAPWCGGNPKILIGVIKQVLYKSLGRTSLCWSELDKVLLDVVIHMNNRPPTYIDEGKEGPTLIPDSIILGRGTKMVDRNMIEVRKKFLVGKSDKSM